VTDLRYQGRDVLRFFAVPAYADEVAGSKTGAECCRGTARGASSDAVRFRVDRRKTTGSERGAVEGGGTASLNVACLRGHWTCCPSLAFGCSELMVSANARSALTMLRGAFWSANAFVFVRIPGRCSWNVR
jgi:hypothetical protein